ncbi:hypothetical protein THTE_0236 [Thermogutta terrifontis]|uniref:Uncharacterized protein n=1 Tax=Thermogutta terrifontis TaxID=1331910 RepID=A0A286RA52_9BACT|nr:hypothetical protein THTE_0236 [Thermogutta terrifontis]
MPKENELIIERCTADLTSGALRDTLRCVDWRIGCPQPVTLVRSRPRARW